VIATGTFRLAKETEKNQNSAHDVHCLEHLVGEEPAHFRVHSDGYGSGGPRVHIYFNEDATF